MIYGSDNLSNQYFVKCVDFTTCKLTVLTGMHMGGSHK
jgi:hypothetical protein